MIQKIQTNPNLNLLALRQTGFLCADWEIKLGEHCWQLLLTSAFYFHLVGYCFLFPKMNVIKFYKLSNSIINSKIKCALKILNNSGKKLTEIY